MHFKTGLFYYFQDPPRQYKSGIVTMVWLTFTFHTVIHSVALNCGAEDNMGWRVATQVYDGHSSGRLGLGHLGHLAAGGTPRHQPPPWWTQLPLGLLCHICSWRWWHFVQCFIFDTFSSNSQSDFHKRENARFSHLWCYMVCKLCQFWNNIYMCSINHVLFLIPTSFKIVASIVVRTTNCQWERARLIWHWLGSARKLCS